MRRITKQTRRLRREMTAAERAFWFAVRDRRFGGFKFRRQVAIGPYIVDFLCAEARLIVEIDGGQHTEEADRDRTAHLAAAGYSVLRFWNTDILGNMDGVLQTLQAALPPSPYGRGPG